MKIAVVTDDERTLSQHFGRAQYFLVVTLEDGRVVSRERRDKPGHAQFASEPHEHHHESHGPEGRHGYGRGAESRHARMAAVIEDCQAVLCGGMGAGMYDNLQARGIQAIVTDIASIEEAVAAYAQGRIVNRADLLH